jgi:hypothetical protein
LYLAQSNGDFVPANPQFFAVRASSPVLLLGDFDRDSDLDGVISGDDPTTGSDVLVGITCVLDGHGDGTFSESYRGSDVIERQWLVNANGDDRPDILYVTAYSRTRVLLNSSTLPPPYDAFERLEPRATNRDAIDLLTDLV